MGVGQARAVNGARVGSAPGNLQYDHSEPDSISNDGWEDGDEIPGFMDAEVGHTQVLLWRIKANPRAHWSKLIRVVDRLSAKCQDKLPLAVLDGKLVPERNFGFLSFATPEEAAVVAQRLRKYLSHEVQVLTVCGTLEDVECLKSGGIPRVLDTTDQPHAKKRRKDASSFDVRLGDILEHQNSLIRGLSKLRERYATVSEMLPQHGESSAFAKFQDALNFVEAAHEALQQAHLSIVQNEDLAKAEAAEHAASLQPEAADTGKPAVPDTSESPQSASVPMPVAGARPRPPPPPRPAQDTARTDGAGSGETPRAASENAARPAPGQDAGKPPAKQASPAASPKPGVAPGKPGKPVPGKRPPTKLGLRPRADLSKVVAGKVAKPVGTAKVAAAPAAKTAAALGFPAKPGASPGAAPAATSGPKSSPSKSPAKGEPVGASGSAKAHAKVALAKPVAPTAPPENLDETIQSKMKELAELKSRQLRKESQIQVNGARHPQSAEEQQPRVSAVYASVVLIPTSGMFRAQVKARESEDVTKGPVRSEYRDAVEDAKKLLLDIKDRSRQRDDRARPS